MSVKLPKLRVGEPVRHQALSLFPLYSDANSKIEYRLSDVALADESLLVEEVGESGSVPVLLVENRGDIRVLFLEGEELVGAKQNRILNTSVLVAAHSKTQIPVSCVEQGRWRRESRYFGSSGSHSPSKVRRALKASVSKSVKEKRGYRSNQTNVWREVAKLHAMHGVSSRSAAMSDAFDAYQDQINSYREQLTYVQDAIGVAVAIGDRIVSVDVFDKPSTCEKVWHRLLSGVVFDAMEPKAFDKLASVSDVQQLIAVTGELSWERAEAVGEGEEYRAQSQRGDHASALALNDTVVHESLMAAV